MAITRYAGDRFVIGSSPDTKPTGVLLGAFLINSGNQTSYVKTGNSSLDSDWATLQGGGGGGTPADPETSVQFFFLSFLGLYPIKSWCSRSRRSFRRSHF